MDVSGIVQILESISFLSIILWLVGKTVDALFSRIIDEQIISEFASGILRRVKIYRTKYRPIGAKFEYSLNLKENIQIKHSKKNIEQCVYHCEDLSRGSLEIIRFDWTDKTTARVDVSYISDKDLAIEINLLPNTNSFRSPDMENILESELSSVGVDIQFQFDFHNLRGAILNLNNLADFLLRSIESEFDVRSVSNSTITVSSLDDNLTLDDWIKDKQFDVSLLLQSENEERSVEFIGDRAVISSPYTGMDDTTAEYIEATLLNYYL